MSGIADLFKYMNTPEIVDKWWSKLTFDTYASGALADAMMGDEEFMASARDMVSDEVVLRQKIETKIGQQWKSMSAVKKEAPPPRPAAPVAEPVKVEIGWPDEDEDKGKHIGQGVYLKREGCYDQIIKMTTPQFVVYY